VISTDKQINPIIKTSMVDLDDDDYPEKFVGSIVFPSDAANLKNIELYVFFSYGIRSIIKM